MPFTLWKPRLHALPAAACHRKQHTGRSNATTEYNACKSGGSDWVKECDLCLQIFQYMYLHFPTWIAISFSVFMLTTPSCIIGQFSEPWPSPYTHSKMMLSGLFSASQILAAAGALLAVYLVSSTFLAWYRLNDISKDTSWRHSIISGFCAIPDPGDRRRV